MDMLGPCGLLKPSTDPWSSPHSISGISGKVFKQSGKSGISRKPVESIPEYPENPEKYYMSPHSIL